MFKPISSFSCGVLASSALICTSTANQGPLQIFPKPQRVNFANSMAVSRQALAKAQLVLLDKDESKNPAAAKELFAKMPAQCFSGAYAISISPKQVLLVARDARGLFYAQNTLQQILATLKDDKIPSLEILDWPDIEFRGTVEGFYGRPWSHQARKSQLAFYGITKMNTYIYGPKDDPYHSRNWREAYPQKEAAQIRELVEVAKANHVDFVWAIHPGGSIKWTPEDMGNVIKKFELMYDLGVRSFAVFFDDIGGEGTNPQRQAELLNMIHTGFIEKKGDCTPLIMCPTQYNRSWTSGDYLDVLGSKLHPSVHIMWTGNTVVHDIKAEGQQWVNQRTKRPTYFWFNWPVTDYVRSYLGMGRLYGQMQQPGEQKLVSGFVSNPMDKPEASKVALFSVADYCWNMQDFDSRSDNTWRAGIKRLYPQCSEQMQLFCEHASDFGPNTHGYRRDESVKLAALIKNIQTALKDKKMPASAELQSLQAELKAMHQAKPVIEAKLDNADLWQEIQPWVVAMANTGNAGDHALQALQAAEGDTATVQRATLQALGAFHEIQRQGEEFRANKQSDNVPRFASLHVSPLVKNLTLAAAEKLYVKLSGKPVVNYTPSAKGGNLNGMEHIFDGNRSSFWHSGHYCQPGDWYALDFATEITLRSVELLMGRKDNDNDYVKTGQFEYSIDGNTWQPLGAPTSGAQVAWSGEPVQAKAVRYRVIEPMSAGKRNVWTAIREFAVNNPPPPKVLSNIPALAQLGTQSESKLIRINQLHEVIAMQPGQELGIEFAAPIKTTWVEVNAENPAIDQWGEVLVELGQSGKLQPLAMQRRGNNLVNTNPPEGIKRVIFRNKSDKPQDAKFSMFKVDIPPVDESRQASSLQDGSLMSSYSCERAFSVELPNQQAGKAAKLLLVGSAKVQLEAQLSGGEWQPLQAGDNNSGLLEYKLPQGGVKALRVSCDKPQPGAYIHELIYR